ncbi:hypothetical protein Drorol1_Dr00009411 [Drosera rotundifolia]
MTSGECLVSCLVADSERCCSWRIGVVFVCFVFELGGSRCSALWCIAGVQFLTRRASRSGWKCPELFELLQLVLDARWVSFGEAHSLRRLVYERSGDMSYVGRAVSLFDMRFKSSSLATCRENSDKAGIASWVVHQNAVFDICWIKDDAKILTASADQTARATRDEEMTSRRWEAKVGDCRRYDDYRWLAVNDNCRHSTVAIDSEGRQTSCIEQQREVGDSTARIREIEGISVNCRCVHDRKRIVGGGDGDLGNEADEG